MTSGAIANEGDGHESGHMKNLAATRTLGMAGSELAPVVGRQALGTSLCIFGIAFAGFAVGLRDEDPQSFDLSILLAILGFAALITIIGVVTAVLRKEEGQQARPTLTTEMIAMNSRSITDLANRLNITNHEVLESLRDASSVADLRTRLQAAQGDKKNTDSNLASLNDRILLGELDVVRVALDRAPLSH